MELLEHSRSRLVESRPCAQTGIGQRRALVHGRKQLGVKHEHRIGIIPRHFLLDGAPFLVPLLRAVINAAHAVALDAQGDVRVLGRDGVKVLRHGLLSVSVKRATHGGGDLRQLIRGKARAAAKRHVFLGMGRARETLGRLDGARQVIHHRGDHRSQAVRHNHHPQAVRQRRAQDVLALISLRIAGRVETRRQAQGGGERKRQDE